MLTRSRLESDFAPDASVYEAERDAETGGRRLEQLAFEIVNEQALGTQTTKARALSGEAALATLHVYGGDFFHAPRSEWRGSPFTRHDYDSARLRAIAASGK